MREPERVTRQIGLFGAAGQQMLDATRVCLIGCGGVGSHVAQQLALLRVMKISLVDPEELDVTNRNRYVTGRENDPIPGSKKVDLAERTIREIDSTIVVERVPEPFVSKAGFAAIAASDYVFGALDTEGGRLILNEVCAAYSKPLIDLSTDVFPDDSSEYGGRVCVAWDGTGCLYCLGAIDVKEAQEDLTGASGERLRRALYGVDKKLLGRSGPSVVSINGVVASLGVTEFMAGVTGLRRPVQLAKYYGRSGKVVVAQDAPSPGCYYCSLVRGSGAASGVGRYVA